MIHKATGKRIREGILKGYLKSKGEPVSTHEIAWESVVRLQDVERLLSDAFGAQYPSAEAGALVGYGEGYETGEWMPTRAYLALELRAAKAALSRQADDSLDNHNW